MEPITKEKFDELYRTHVVFMSGNMDNYDPMIHGNFSGLKFKNFDFNGMNVSNANFRNSIFENCVMQCGTFKDCCFDGCTFLHVKADCAIFDNSTFRYATFYSYDESSNEFFDASFYNCSFKYANIKNTYFSKSSFKGSDIISSRFTNCSFGACIFDDIGFDIDDRKIIGYTTFDKCILAGVSINDVENIEHVDFESCVFDISIDPMGIEGLKYLNRKLYRKTMWRRLINRPKKVLHRQKEVAEN